MYEGWQRDDDESSVVSATQMKDVMEELRGFRPYLRRRLQYIRDSNRSLELQDEITDMEYYLSVMTDSQADLVHGMDQLRGFVNKLHEMAYKKPVPKGFKYKSEEEYSSGTSSADNYNSQEEGEKGVAVGDLEKRLKRGKEFQDWRITENLKSLRDPETETVQKELPWVTTYKSTHQNESGNEAPSTLGVTPSKENQSTSQPVTTPDWLQESTDDRIDPLVSAGLEDICERRAKKVEVKPILKDPQLRPNPLFRPSQPGGPNQLQHQTPAIPQAAPPHPRVAQVPGPYPLDGQGPQAPNPNQQGPGTPGLYQRVPQAHVQYRPVVNQPLTTIPSWLHDEPSVSYQPTSYDYSRSAPPGAIMRQPPIASTYVSGYGHIEIMPPLQGTPFPPPQPRTRFQQSEYQVPRDVLPNPFYNPRHQHQPVVMNGPQNRHYSHPAHDLHVEQRGSRFNQDYSLTPARSAPSFPDSPGWDNDDNESSMSYGSYRKSQMQQKRVQFQRNTATARPPKNPRYFHRDQAETKRGGSINKSRQQQQTRPFNNFKRKSTVRQIMEKGQQKLYKLGQHEKITEDVEEDDFRTDSVESPERRDSSSSSPSPEKNNELTDLVKLALSKIMSKKELDRVKKDESALKALLKETPKISPPTKPTKKKVRAKEDVSLVKKGKKPQQQKNRTVEDTSKESPSKSLNGFSSESECGSIVSSMSTRSVSRRRANQEKSTDSETSCPGTSRRKVSRNMAVKSGAKGKGNNVNFANIVKKSPSPQRIRKRIVKPLASDSENDHDEENANSGEETATATKQAEKTKLKPTSAMIQECVTEFMSEQSRKKKNTEVDPNYWHKKKVVNEKGGQLIRQNDILVNRSLNKIYLGHEYAEAEGFVKQEIKTENHDNEAEAIGEGDCVQDVFGNPMIPDPECEIIEVDERGVEEMPENVVEVLMETSDCENDRESGEIKDNEHGVLEFEENPVIISIQAEAPEEKDRELETLDLGESENFGKGENEDNQTEA